MYVSDSKYKGAVNTLSPTCNAVCVLYLRKTFRYWKKGRIIYTHLQNHEEICWRFGGSLLCKKYKEIKIIILLKEFDKVYFYFICLKTMPRNQFKFENVAVSAFPFILLVSPQNFPKLISYSTIHHVAVYTFYNHCYRHMLTLTDVRRHGCNKMLF